MSMRRYKCWVCGQSLHQDTLHVQAAKQTSASGVDWWLNLVPRCWDKSGVQANSFHFAVKVSKRQVLAQQCCGAGWRAKQQQLSFWLLQNIPECNEGRSSRKLWKSWVCKFNKFASYWFNCCYNKEMGRLIQILLYDFVYFLEFTGFD